jgi:hypothetical protein
MARFMTLMISLLLSLSAGCGTYALGAIVWCVIDPEGVGARMLFTIPIALAGMTIPGVIGLIGYAFRCDFIREPKLPKQLEPMPELVAFRPTRTSRPATKAMDEEIDFVLAT